MFAQRRVACRIVAKGVRLAAGLRGKDGEHCSRGHLAGFECPAGMTEIAELDRVAETVGSASPPEHLDQILGAKRVQPLYRSGVRRWIEQRGALCR